MKHVVCEYLDALEVGKWKSNSVLCASVYSRPLLVHSDALEDHLLFFDN